MVIKKLVVKRSISSGWTTFVPSVDTAVIYVSNSVGNDSNDGTDDAHPVKTLAQGISLLTTGKPDWLLLKKGDTWTNETLTGGGGWVKSGRSDSERMLISSYGTGARPLIRTGTATCIEARSDTVTNHLAMVGLEMFPHTYTGGNIGANFNFGVSFPGIAGNMSNMTVEDCYIHGYAQAITVNKMTNLRVRRNVLADANSQSSVVNCQGFGGALLTNPYFEENYFLRNGWGINSSVETGLRHNAYFNEDCTGAQFLNNLVIGCDGIQFRAGGTFQDNFIWGVVNAINFGGGSLPLPAGVSGFVRRNVVGGGVDSVAIGVGGWGLKMVNVNTDGTTVDYNIFVNSPTGTMGRPWQLLGDDTFAQLFKITFQNNLIHNWRVESSGETINLTGVGGDSVSDIVFASNEFYDIATSELLMRLGNTGLEGFVTSTGNHWHRTNGVDGTRFNNGSANRTFAQFMSDLGDVGSAYESSNPYSNYANATLTKYAQSLGLADEDAFVARCRLQSKDTWNPLLTTAAINPYMRAIYGR